MQIVSVFVSKHVRTILSNYEKFSNSFHRFLPEEFMLHGFLLRL